jgi:hypothetical protein
LPLKLSSTVRGRGGFLRSGFLGGGTRGGRRHRCLLRFLALRDLLLEGGDATAELARRVFVLLLELPQLLPQVFRLLGGRGERLQEEERRDGEETLQRLPTRALAVATTPSVWNPNFLCSSLRGAEAPKVFMPITWPDSPT